MEDNLNQKTMYDTLKWKTTPSKITLNEKWPEMDYNLNWKMTSGKTTPWLVAALFWLDFTRKLNM